MAEKIISVEFDEAGDPTIRPTGFAGRECTVATEAAEDALGLVDSKRVETADMRRQPDRQKVTR